MPLRRALTQSSRTSCLARCPAWWWLARPMPTTPPPRALGRLALAQRAPCQGRAARLGSSSSSPALGPCPAGLQRRPPLPPWAAPPAPLPPSPLACGAPLHGQWAPWQSPPAQQQTQPLPRAPLPRLPSARPTPRSRAPPCSAGPPPPLGGLQQQQQQQQQQQTGCAPLSAPLPRAAQPPPHPLPTAAWCPCCPPPQPLGQTAAAAMQGPGMAAAAAVAGRWLPPLAQRPQHASWPAPAQRSGRAPLAGTGRGSTMTLQQRRLQRTRPLQQPWQQQQSRRAATAAPTAQQQQQQQQQQQPPTAQALTLMPRPLQQQRPGPCPPLLPCWLQWQQPVAQLGGMAGSRTPPPQARPPQQQPWSSTPPLGQPARQCPQPAPPHPAAQAQPPPSLPQLPLQWPLLLLLLQTTPWPPGAPCAPTCCPLPPQQRWLPWPARQQQQQHPSALLLQQQQQQQH